MFGRRANQRMDYPAIVIDDNKLIGLEKKGDYEVESKNTSDLSNFLSK